MYALVADEEDTGRREPDFARLKKMIDAGCQAKGLLTPDGRPSYRLLGPRIGRSTSVIYGIISDGSWPTYETLVSLADFFGQPRSEWLVAGGFAPNAMPPAWQKMRPAVLREYRALSQDQRLDVIRELESLEGDG